MWLSEPLLCLVALIGSGMHPEVSESPEVEEIRMQAVKLNYAEYYAGPNDEVFWRWKLPAEWDTGRKRR